MSWSRIVVAGAGTELAVARPVSARTSSMSVVYVVVMFPSDVVEKFIPRKVWMWDSSVRRFVHRAKIGFWQ